MIYNLVYTGLNLTMNSEKMLLVFTGSEQKNLIEGQTKASNITVIDTRSGITTKNAPLYDTESNSRWECSWPLRSSPL